MELLGKWKPMDVEDSLELLSSHYTNPTVRRYAVARLRQADDEVHCYSLLLFNWVHFKLEPDYGLCVFVYVFVCVREREREIFRGNRIYYMCLQKQN